MPRLGLGTYLIPNTRSGVDSMLHALKSGYQHIDTASFYGNEISVGQAVRESGFERESIFVTTKLWVDDHGHSDTGPALKESLKRLDFSYVDLFLSHWPVPGKRVETWKAMEALYEKGLCRAIGVSNYMVSHLEEILNCCSVKPAVNQLELSPYNYRSRFDILNLCRDSGIIVQAYSPLTKGQKINAPELKCITDRHDKTTAQILIRWALEHDLVVLPKSGHPDRISENADVYDFTLNPTDLEELDNLDCNLVTSWNPEGVP